MGIKTVVDNASAEVCRCCGQGSSYTGAGAHVVMVGRQGGKEEGREEEGKEERERAGERGRGGGEGEKQKGND